MFKDYCNKAYKNSLDHGFYDNAENKSIPVKLMLIVSELSEALEAYRKDNHADMVSYERFLEFDSKGVDIHFRELIKDSFEDEIADVFIRLFDLCGFLRIDIKKYIDAKMNYNSRREYKHGNKKC